MCLFITLRSVYWSLGNTRRSSVFTLRRHEELCASGTEMNNSQQTVIRVKLCAFQEIICVCRTWLYAHEEQSPVLYKKPTNYHMNV